MNSNKKDVEIISLIGLAHSISHFFHLIIAPLFPWIKEEFGLTYAELGLLMTTFYVVSSVVQSTSGLLVDRYGARPLLFIGIFFLMISAFILGLSQTYTMLLIGVSIAGIGNGVFHPVDYTMINHLVKQKNLAHAYSVHGVTGYLGWAAAPLFLLSLTALFDSWRVAQFGAGILAGVVLLILLYRRKQLEDDVVEENQLEENAPIATLAIFKLPSMWMSWLFFYLTSFGFAGIQSFSSSALVDIYQIPISLTASSYTLFMICSALGLIAGGFVATKISDPDRVITTAFLISGVMAIVTGMGIFPGWTVPVLFALMGFGGGMAGPARDLMVRAGTPKGASGRIFGLVYSGIDFGAASGPVLFGLFMDWKSPEIIFYSIAVLQLFAVLVAHLLNQHNKNKLAVI
ncbi:MFS transporter [Polynucleobacter sp. SHI8]|uniref:MFS transporter n=1 Tax=unclassified Polynucleobacter TaxID=2640945 RepID=UPI0024939A75|nr:MULTISPECIES: MFS transporter [unclassified Polynucleobacter]BDW10779.1 MFS transporter [Polynucleobacter sp. SHI2]BDW13225.1 MFS transporter [Polynucleobacter sp. SHI8]